MSYNSKNIKVIEIGLINKCNLNCPLCLRNTTLVKTLKKDYLDYDRLVELLEQLPNLERVVLMGSLSEPTLYPHFFQLITYFKDRNLKVRISTNGSTNDDKWWNQLGTLLNEDDIVRFPIDGSTEELHQKYRRGSSIEKVLSSHRAFKKHSTCTTILQNILFEYNYNDKENIKEIYYREGFDLCEYSPCYEPRSVTPKMVETGILPEKQLLRYQKVKNNIIKTSKPAPFKCPELRDEAIYLSHTGLLVPCNEQEDTFLDTDEILPTIYTASLDEQLEFCNEIIEDINSDPVCIQSCSKMGQEECFAFPITQHNEDWDKFELIDFRECMKR